MFTKFFYAFTINLSVIIKERNLVMQDDLNPKELFAATSILKMFNMSMTKPTFLNLEEKKLIPTPHRIPRGKTSTRMWELNQLPLIGEKYGFFKKPKSPHVISVFSLKGGTNKSTFAFQLGRTLALHNIKTLIIGMDAQESITQTIRGPGFDYESAEESMGIYHVLKGEVSPFDVIESTDLETLDLIPETIELSVLNRWLGTQSYADKLISKKVVKPLINEYDMIIFDCNPSWDSAVTNALDASDILLSPLGCDINSLKATAIFTDLLVDFQEARESDFSIHRLIPTMAENNKLSQQILAKYRLDYNDICTIQHIRRAVHAQEANVQGKSLLETQPKAPVTSDYIGILSELSDLIKEIELNDAEFPIESNNQGNNLNRQNMSL